MIILSTGLDALIRLMREARRRPAPTLQKPVDRVFTR